MPQEEAGLLLPPMKRIRDVAAVVAKAVAIEARDSGLGRLLSDERHVDGDAPPARLADRLERPRGDDLHGDGDAHLSRFPR